MTNSLLSPTHIFNGGLLLIRVITGILMVYHGLEVFDSDKITGYSQWMTDLKFPLPTFMAYLGKGSEFIGGACLILGLFTRLACIPLIVTMLVVTFFMGEGRVFTDEQHPFLFALLSAMFVCVGAGKWSLDHYFFSNSHPVSDHRTIE